MNSGLITVSTPPVESSNQFETPHDKVAENYNPAPHVKVNSIFGGANLTNFDIYQPFNMELAELDFTITPTSIIKKDMTKYLTIDETGVFRVANLRQIYRLKADISLFGSIVAQTTIVTDIQSISFSFTYGNVSYTYSPISDEIVADGMSQRHVVKIINKSNSRTNTNKETVNNNFLRLSANYYPELVLAGSNSFYNDYGSNWGSQLMTIFDDSGYEDTYDSFSDLNIFWNLRYLFVFISGGPSSSNILTFSNDWHNFIRGRSPSDGIFPFHAAVLVAGHNFANNYIGLAGENTFHKIEHPDDLIPYNAIAVTQANFDDSMHRNKYVLTHEIGHITNGVHAYITAFTSNCWSPWSWKTVYGISLMDPYHGTYFCFSGAYFTSFFWNSINANRIETRVSNHI